MNHYRYTDFSNFTKKDASSAEARNAATLAVRQAAVSASQLSGERVSSLTSGSTSASASFNRSELLAQVLPYKLDAMLSDPSISHIITWMPHGRAWKILRSKEFTDQVLPIYFNHPNYNSFIRLVNAWGFRRVTTGLDANAYFHELFLRNMPQLHGMMRRMTKNQKKIRLDQEDEPDFYKMKPLGGDTHPTMSNATSAGMSQHCQIQHQMNIMAKGHTTEQIEQGTTRVDDIVPAAGLARVAGNVMTIVPGGEIIIPSDIGDSNSLLINRNLHADALSRNKDMTSLLTGLRDQHVVTNVPMIHGAPLQPPGGLLFHQHSGLQPSNGFGQNSLGTLLLAQVPGLSPILQEQRGMVDRRPHMPVSLQQHQHGILNSHLRDNQILEHQVNTFDIAHQRELQLLLLSQQLLPNQQLPQNQQHDDKHQAFLLGQIPPSGAQPLNSFVTGMGQGNSVPSVQYLNPPKQFGEITSSQSLPVDAEPRRVTGRQFAVTTDAQTHLKQQMPEHR